MARKTFPTMFFPKGSCFICFLWALLFSVTCMSFFKVREPEPALFASSLCVCVNDTLSFFKGGFQRMAIYNW